MTAKPTRDSTKKNLVTPDWNDEKCYKSDAERTQHVHIQERSHVKRDAHMTCN